LSGARSRSPPDCGETHPGRPDWHVCHETIYQAAFYHGGTRGLSRQLTVQLGTGRPLRKRRRRADERSPRFVAPALLIDQRPDAVEQRTRIGDWKAISSPDGSTAQRSAPSSTEPAATCSSSTSLTDDAPITAEPDSSPRWAPTGRGQTDPDLGSEMACHDQLAELFVDGVFFAYPVDHGSRRSTRTPTVSYTNTSPGAPNCRSTPTPTSAP
jgi:IS30 family transposase